MQKLKFLYPDFLRQIDRYLLLNYPHVWRTRVHEFGWFSLIIGNVLAMVLGILMARTRYGIALVYHDSSGILSPIDIPLPSFFSVQVIKFLFFVLVLIWAFKLRQFKMQAANYRHVLLVWSIYIGCIFCLYSNVATFITGNAIGVTTYKSPPFQYLHSDYKLFESMKNGEGCFSNSESPLGESKCYAELKAPLDRYKYLIDAKHPLHRADFRKIIEYNYPIIKAHEFLRQPFQKIKNYQSSYQKDLFYQFQIARLWIFFLSSMLFIPMLLFLCSNFRKAGLILLIFPVFFFEFSISIGNPFYADSIGYIATFSLFLVYTLISTTFIYGYLKQKYTPATT